MRFRCTLEAINALETIYQAGSEEYKKAYKVASETYKNEALIQKTSMLREALTDSRRKEIEKAKSAIKADFSEVRKAVSDMVTASVPDDFAATLAAVQAKVKDISEDEAKIIVQKYSGNYLAASSLVSVLHANEKGEDIAFRSPFDIANRIDQVEELVCSWVDQHISDDIDGLASALMCSEESSPVSSIARELNTIEESGFVI